MESVEKMYLSSSPHVSKNNSTRGIMLCVIITLMPLCVYGTILFGLKALCTIAVSVLSCVFFEWGFQKLAKQKIRIKDLSAVVTGILLALTLPPDVPLWMTVLGSLFAIVVAKEFFGGIGANVFNPALIGRAFMFVSFPEAMGTWKAPYDAVSSATPLVTKASSYFDLFIGNRAGCIGESCILLILLGFLALLSLKIIDFRTPLSMIVTTGLFSFIFGENGFFTGDVIYAVLSGGLLFGAVFMATDYATSPVTAKGKIIFGFGCGLITFLIRRFGGYPEGVMFSILIMNVLVPFLNKITDRKYGFVSAKKGA